MEHTASDPLPPYASETLLRLTPPGCPEDRLMLAVLLDAVAVLRERATGVCPHATRLVSSTGRWFASADESWPLSFVNVCRTLGLDPGPLREGLRRELADLGAHDLLDLAGARVVPFVPAGAALIAGVSIARRRTRG
jgi:hypothetical protein